MQTILLELLKFILTRYAKLFIMTFANLTQLFIHAYYLKKMQNSLFSNASEIIFISTHRKFFNF